MCSTVNTPKDYDQSRIFGTEDREHQNRCSGRMNSSVNSSRFNSRIYDTGQRAKLHPARKTPARKPPLHSCFCRDVPSCQHLTFSFLSFERVYQTCPAISPARTPAVTPPQSVLCGLFRQSAVSALAFHPCERYAPSTAVLRVLAPRTEAQRRDGSRRWRGTPCPALLSVIVSNSAYES